MKIKISMDDTKISGTSSVLSNSLIMGGENDDVRIKLHNLDVGEQARLLENLEISSVLEELSKRVEGMDKDADEYCEIQEILKVRQWNREGFTRCITKHLGEFSQGVLASVVANFITGFIV